MRASSASRGSIARRPARSQKSEPGSDTQGHHLGLQHVRTPARIPPPPQAQPVEKSDGVVFVGYQGEGTWDAACWTGVKSVKLFGEEIAVKARIVNFHGSLLPRRPGRPAAVDPSL